VSLLAMKMLTIVGLLSLVAGILAWSHASARRTLLRLTELLDERGGEASGFRNVVLKGHYQGRRVAFRLIPGSRYRPRILHVAFTEGASLWFQIQKETMGNFLAAHVGLIKDIELGDENLDRDYVFSSREPERFANWVRAAGVMAAVETLMKERGVDLLAQDQEMRAELRRFSRREASPENVREILDGLSALRRTLERA
jgi:hypothetical protein